MVVVDSSGWLEYFMNGELAEKYSEYLSKPKKVLTPAVVLYEVFKVIKKQAGESFALQAAAQMNETQIAPLNESLAYHAANVALEHKLAMADAMVYATANFYQLPLVTSDADFKSLPGVTFLGHFLEFS